MTRTPNSGKGKTAAQLNPKQWDAVMRREAADKILDSADPRQTFRETVREYGLQSYQLYAWVGQAALVRRQKSVDSRGPGEQPRRQKPEPVGKGNLPAGLPATLSLEEAVALARVLAERR